MKTRYWIALAAITGSGAGALSVLVERPMQKPLPVSAVHAEPRPVLNRVVAAAPKKSESVIRSPSSSAGAGSPSRQEAWKKFARQFGESLAAEWLPDGRLSSVHGGAVLSAVPADSAFRTDDPQRAIARAREILNASMDLLGIEARSPLGDPIARTGPASAQIEFQQSFEGKAVAPFGRVSISLGSRGELLSLDSSYVSGVDVTNEASLGSGELQSAALAAVGERAIDEKVTGGTPVVWLRQAVSDSQAGRVEGRVAYQYWASGRQIVIDASNGQVLSQRDRRIF